MRSLIGKLPNQSPKLQKHNPLPTRDIGHHEKHTGTAPAYLAKMPAVSAQSGHKAALSVAVALVRGFNLNEEVRRFEREAEA